MLVGALADWQREQIAERGLEPLMGEIELPLVAVLREMELLGVRLNVERLARSPSACATRSTSSNAEIFALAGTSS